MSQAHLSKPADGAGWWQSFYEDSPLEFYMARTDHVELQGTIDFLRRHLNLQPGAKIFDQCCGLGGMSIPLARQGYRLVGVDLCRKYIGMATAEAQAGKLDADFNVGDAFSFEPDAPCDAAFNWYTSFGYAGEDSQNIRMIERAFAAIKPGASFALDFLNMPMILTAFKEAMQTTLHSPAGEIKQTRACSIDMQVGLMLQRWTWVMPDGRKLEKNSTLRAYLPWDLVRLFKQVGFEDVRLYGGIDDSPLTAESGRCIIVGRRPL